MNTPPLRHARTGTICEDPEHCEQGHHRPKRCLPIRATGGSSPLGYRGRRALWVAPTRPYMTTEARPVTR